MSDLISRQAAIDALCKAGGASGHCGVSCDDVKAIEALPSLQPERIKGKWQWLASTYDRTPCEMRFRCSACHHETITHGSDPWEKFCPNCGADMREKGENATD